MLRTLSNSSTQVVPSLCYIWHGKLLDKNSQGSIINLLLTNSQKALDLCDNPTIPRVWGTNTDAAWTLRRAFEAIKKFAASQGSYSKRDFEAFWARVQDSEGFLKMAP